jgi:hypothetical protein
MAGETKPEVKTKKPRTDRKVSIQKIQSIVGTLEKRIAADETAETKMSVKELTSLGNTVAKLTRILQEVDKQNLQRDKAIAKANKHDLFNGGRAI